MSVNEVTPPGNYPLYIPHKSNEKLAKVIRLTPFSSIIHRIGHVPPHPRTLVNLLRTVRITHFAVGITQAFDELARQHFPVRLVFPQGGLQIARIVGTAHLGPTFVAVRKYSQPLLCDDLFQLFLATSLRTASKKVPRIGKYNVPKSLSCSISVSNLKPNSRCACHSCRYTQRPSVTFRQK